MIILHASLLNGNIFFWGERSTTAETLNLEIPDWECPDMDRRPWNDEKWEGPNFPFDIGIRGLEEALLHAGASLRNSALQAPRVWAWLPATGFKPGQPWLPSPSSQTVIDLPTSESSPERLLPFNVTAFPLKPEAETRVLSRIAGKKSLATGVFIARDAAFLAEAFKFSTSLVARERFMPSVEFRISEHPSGDFSDNEDGSGDRRRLHAVWTPAPGQTDRITMASLAASAPPSAFCLAEKYREPEALRTGIEKILMKSIAWWVDRIVRTPIPATLQTAPPRHMRTQTKFDSIHDSWMHALKNPDDSEITGDTKNVAELASIIQLWQKPMVTVRDATFKLCFRLTPPDDKDDSKGSDIGPEESCSPWKVTCLAQSSKDPSLLLELADLWRGTCQISFNPLELREIKRSLLLALGTAASICPNIFESLRTRAPEGYLLDLEGAYDFLKEKACLLEEAGFKTILPPWWIKSGKGPRISLSAKVSGAAGRGTGALKLDKMLDFEWQTAVGDTLIDPAELERLASAKVPLVKVRGKWVELDRESLERAVEFWKTGRGGKATLGDIVRMHVGMSSKAVSAGEMGFDFAGVQADGWVAEVLSRLGDRKGMTEVPQPEWFIGTLRPYQLKGLAWLEFLRDLGLGACLADDMGLGKTIQALALMLHCQNDRKRPALVICPTSVLTNWAKECAKFAPRLTAMVHYGPERPASTDFLKVTAKKDLIITSYGIMTKDIELIKQVEWSMIILDEAQKVKNPTTKQSKAARNMRAVFRMALTGTPLENHVGDLWAIMDFLNPGLLGNFAEFSRNFLVPIQARKDQTATALLRRMTAPFILRRLKTDKSVISDLPEKLEMKVYCNLSEEQASLYRAVLIDAQKSLQGIEGIQRKGIVLRTITRLKQVCNHPRHLLRDNSEVEGRSGKLERLLEMLEEIAESGEKSLVFTQFAEMGEILRTSLQDHFGDEVLFLHGGTPKARRDKMVDNFQKEGPGPKIFVLSIRAGGIGLNLTRANHVFHFDRWWNPAVEEQATDRAYRIGQTSRVQVHKFICAGTLEDSIDEILSRKTGLAMDIVGSGEAWLTDLSDSELRDVLTLRREVLFEYNG